MSVCQGTSQAQKVFLPNMGRTEKLNWELEVFCLITMGSQHHLLASHLPRLGEWALLVWLMTGLRPLHLHGLPPSLLQRIGVAACPALPPSALTHFPCCRSPSLKNSVDECSSMVWRSPVCLKPWTPTSARNKAIS